MSDELVIRWEVDEVRKLTRAHRFSPFHHHHGIPWRLIVCTENSNRTNNVNCFSIYLCCDQDVDCALWTVECSFSLAVIHSDILKKNICYKAEHTFSAPKWTLGWPGHVTYAKLLESSEGFVEDDRIIVEGRVKIKTVRCISLKPILDFSQPSPDADNIALKLDDGTLYGCRRYLMWHSPYFASLFMENGINKEEIEIKDVKVDDFNELLQVIFPSERPINEDSYSAVLKLANRFQIERALDAVEKFLIKSKKVMTATKLLLAEQYGMETLMKHCMNSLKRPKQVKALESATEFSQMSVVLKVSLLAKVFELLKPTEG